MMVEDLLFRVSIPKALNHKAASAGDIAATDIKVCRGSCEHDLPSLRRAEGSVFCLWSWQSTSEPGMNRLPQHCDPPNPKPVQPVL